MILYEAKEETAKEDTIIKKTEETIVIKEQAMEVTTNDSQTKEENDESPAKEEVTVICKEPATYAEIVAKENPNETSLLMDESIISVPESPKSNLTAPTALKDATFSPEVDKSMHDARPVINETTLNPASAAGEPMSKDATFSPVVDRSINDSRPHIDMETEFNTTPVHRNVSHRTSTPLIQKMIKRDTPKAGTSSAVSSLAKMFSPKGAASNKEKFIESMSETFNGQFKMVNPLEKSILKSTRKRSLSVADSESFVQKRVVFMSPKFIDIGEIDERLLQSFRDEKETSILKAQMTSGTRRKRSMSATDTPARATSSARVKTPARKLIPDFKAIHEARFKKMESIDENLKRKAERAKKLVTPSKSLPIPPEVVGLPTVFENPTQKPGVASKIPTRKPLVKLPQPSVKENPQIRLPLKRSMSAEPTQGPSQAKKIAFVSALPRSMSQDKMKINFPLIKSKATTAASTSTASTSQSMRGKLEERREHNKSLYKNNARGNVADVRKKNENILKGVRLNRRFELQMQHRGAMDHNDD